MFLSVIAIISCKKDSSDNVVGPNALKAPYYFKGDVNGAAISFVNLVTCQLTPKDSPSFFSLESNWNSVSGPQIQIVIRGGADFRLVAGKNYGYPEFQISCSYVIPGSNPAVGSFYDGGYAGDTTGFVNNFQVGIISIDTVALTVTGTFGGNLSGLDIGSFQHGIRTFTDGMFFLPFKTQ